MQRMKFSSHEMALQENKNVENEIFSSRNKVYERIKVP